MHSFKPHRRRSARAVVGTLFALILAGCATLDARTPVPISLIEDAAVGTYGTVRFWGDVKPHNLTQIVSRIVEQRSAHNPSYRQQERTFLAISGGGSDGAYGAGLLVGWTRTGKRPTFDIVTGVSTGALIAPFAFLGPHYDRELEEIYTHYSTGDLLTPQLIAGLLGGSAITDTTLFEAMVAKYVTRRLLAAIATEHRKGRRLLIGTTNIDAQRPVIWDIGAIAASDQAGNLELVQRILRASASIPGVFPPVPVAVNAEGQTFDELHVDGGITAQVFFLPSQIMVGSLDSQLGLTGSRTLYVIRNGRIDPEYEPVDAKVATLTGRSISTLIKSQANSELDQLAATAQRDANAFRLSYIPRSFAVKSKEPFDQAYMEALFAVGVRRGEDIGHWSTTAP